MPLTAIYMGARDLKVGPMLVQQAHLLGPLSSY